MSARRSLVRLPLIEPGMPKLDGLVATVRRLSIVQSQEEVFAIVTQAARALLQADGVTFVLRDGEECHYVDEDAIGPLWKGRRFPMRACISGWCMLESQQAVIPDITLDARIPQDAYRPTFVRSLVMVPVRQDDPIAAVGAYWSATRETTDEQVELLQAIANAAGLAMARIEVLQSRSRNAERMQPNSVRQQEPREETALPRPAWTHRWSWSGILPNRVSKAFAQFRLEAQGLPFLEPGSFPAYAFAVVSIALATLVRLWLDVVIGPGVVIFAVYLPAVFVTALVAGFASGLVALCLGASLSWLLFLPPYFSMSLVRVTEFVNLGLFIGASGLLIWAAETCRRAIRSLTDEQARRMLLLSELQHRMKNAFAVVQAVVSQSLRDHPELARKIGGRIAALMEGSDLLAGAASRRADLRAVLAGALSPFGPSRIDVEGGPLELPPDQSQALALLAHELATNAAKYGALSNAEGRIRIAWAAISGRLHITWTEQGGPAVQAPERSGFGSSFVERLLAGVGGSIRKSFEPEGLVCVIELPLAPNAS